jgi:homoserine dehydrogenase
VILDVAPSPSSNPSASAGLQTVRLGIAGLGNVGQAVARLAPEARWLDRSAVHFIVGDALVRDLARDRQCPRPARLTTDPEAFLRGRYDVAIEALGTVEPARALVARLLDRGTPVVTANRALVAAHGLELAALAARRGTSLKYEASALAGVPFLGTFSERPFVSDVTKFVAVVNGDPSCDRDGLDAVDRFTLLSSLFGWATPSNGALEVEGIRSLSAADFAAARRLDAAIKPIVWASSHAQAIEAYVGPALVPFRHPLASLTGNLSGIQLAGRFISDLFFSGPGAGPDITAATILDDAIEAVSRTRRFPQRVRTPEWAPALTAPLTEWFVRVRFPGVAPAIGAVSPLLARVGLSTLASTADGETQWVRIAAASREHLNQAITELRYVHRVDTYAIRAL